MKKVITETDVIKIFQSGSTKITTDNNVILTPAARDKILHLKMKIVHNDSHSESEKEAKTWLMKNTVAIGSDHTGYMLKEILKKYFELKKFNIIDVGTRSEDSCDYPDFAIAVSENVISNAADFGLVIDATGIPSAITANKIKGIRAATCYSEFSAWSSRAHNNANVIVVGAKTLGEEAVKSIISKFISTQFEGGRHQKRLDKISSLEK